jgi:hypothetical protein
MDFNFKTGLEERKLVTQMTVFNSHEVDTKKQPMFFGAPLGVQRYDSYKYPVFDKLTQQQLGYFWRPEEISFKKIVEIIKHSAQNRSTFLLLIEVSNYA